MKLSTVRLFLFGSLGVFLALVGSVRGQDKADQKPDKAKEPKPLAVGKDGLKVEAQLTNDDAKVKFGKDSPSKRYPVKMTAGKKYVIEMASADFDSVLLLEDMQGKRVAENDDAPGENTLNSRIVFVAFRDEAVTVVATNLDAKPGKFTLSVREDKGAFVNEAKPLNVDAKGTEQKAALSADAIARVYQVKMAEKKSYVIEMRSKDFDAYLFVFDESGKVLAHDDDGAGGLDSKITFRPTAAGTYRIVAGSLNFMGSGDYILTVREE